MALTNVMRGLAKLALPAAVADGVRAKIMTDAYGRVHLAASDFVANVLRTSEADPIYTNWLPSEVSYSSMTSGVAPGTDYDFYFDMQYFKYVSHHFIYSSALGDVLTLTVGITNQVGVAPASCTYHDAGLKLYGAASFSASDYLAMDLAIPMKWMRVRANITGGNGDGAFDMYSIKSY